ncbi:MAG: hypothetical protein DCC49_03245 [Acidobacteria bacterium]|nr:MAG: hypothetical protein DCC49_03245 [Acidobacteriota bacterium]
MKVILRTIPLALIWAGLWGDLSPANLLTGAIVGFVVVIAWSRRAKPGALEDLVDQGLVPPAVGDAKFSEDESFRINPFRAAIYLAVFAYLLIRSTLDLTIQTLSPRPKIRQAIIECEMQTGSALVATIVANSVSMTPGTLTIEISDAPRKLYVHTLRFTEGSSVQETVATLERLAVRAIRPKESGAKVSR